MPSDTTVRHAREDDIENVAELLRAAFAPYRPRYTAPAFAATTPDSGGILSRMREGPIWLAFDDETPVGTAAAMCRSDPGAVHPSGCYIRGMGVLPDWRSRGIGYLLLNAIEQFATENGADRLVLSTTPFLDDAIRLYVRFGFERSAAGPHDLFGTPLFTMTKNLKTAKR